MLQWILLAGMVLLVLFVMGLWRDAAERERLQEARTLEAARLREKEELEANLEKERLRRLERIAIAENYEFIPLTYLDVPKIDAAEIYYWICNAVQAVDAIAEVKTITPGAYNGKLIFSNMRIIFDSDKAFVDFKLKEIRQVKGENDTLLFLLEDGHALRFEKVDFTLRIILNRILKMGGFA